LPRAYARNGAPRRWLGDKGNVHVNNIQNLLGEFVIAIRTFFVYRIFALCNRLVNVYTTISYIPEGKVLLAVLLLFS
jgi:hypothetical protein